MFVFFFFFFYLGFLLRTFMNRRTAGEGGGHFFNSSLLLLPASWTLRHQPGDYCRELTSAHSYQPDSNREPLVSERKSLTTKLRAFKCMSVYVNMFVTLFLIHNSLILFSHKKSVVIYIFSFPLSQEKFFFSAKTLQFDVNYCFCVYISFERLSSRN